MAHIDPIRKQIELILEQSFGTQFVQKCPTKEHPNRYKLCLHPLIYAITPTQRAMLKDLPNVINFRHAGTDYAPDSTIWIYFNCHPKLIKI